MASLKNVDQSYCEKMPKRSVPCAYCGTSGVPIGRDYVIPKALYPPGWEAGIVQRITVPACHPCNKRWSRDEPHFRTVLAFAGEPNDPVRKLWELKALPSFYEVDGRAQLRGIYEQLRPVIMDGKQRHMIYPGNDRRVVGVVKKIVRGLSHYHRLESAVDESRVWADVRKFSPQKDLEYLGFHHHRDPKIFRYWYEPRIDDEFTSIWRLWFFEMREFVAAVLAPS